MRITTLLSFALAFSIQIFPMEGQTYMGINTNEVNNFDASLPFVDLFKMASPFNDLKDNHEFTRGPVRYDQNGWVTHLNGGQAGTYFLKWMPVNALPPGDVVVRYTGKGTIAYSKQVVVTSQQSGRHTLRFNQDQYGEINAALIVKSSNPRNPIRNISITLPGGICNGNPFQRVNGAQQCAPGQYQAFEHHHKNIVFNPDYLNFMKPFSTVRFMNMSGITRNDKQAEWHHRPLVHQATWGGQEGVRGAPLEIMVKLVNILGADPWFNLPHRASNSYMHNFAAFLKQNLNSHLKAYVEYSNETWNSIFSQTHYIRKKGQELGLDANPFWAGIKYHSHRSKEMFQIFSRHIPSHQLVRVLSGWTENSGITDTLLKSANVYQHTDVFAIAPYFYAEEKDLLNSRTADDLFHLAYSKANPRSIPNILSHLAKQKKLASKYGLPLVAYEGGQGFVYHRHVSKNAHPNTVITAANRDPRMEHAYYGLIDGFYQYGHLFVAFSAPRPPAHFGNWGLKEHIRQSAHTAPKYRAVMGYLQ